MIDLGCDEIDIADTIGVGTAVQVQNVFESIFTFAQPSMFSGHFHDTYGQSLANIFAALQCGVSIFHSSVAGLGGCPYAKGATGNVATEDVLFLMDGLGIHTGINLEDVVSIGHFISNAIGIPNGSRAGRAILSKK
jgi:hydroxymethylglutaryl-CoA lyase